MLLFLFTMRRCKENNRLLYKKGTEYPCPFNNRQRFFFWSVDSLLMGNEADNGYSKLWLNNWSIGTEA